MKILQKLALIALLAATAFPVHAQSEAEVPSPPAEAPHDKTMLEVLEEGGVIMIPLALVSVAMCTLIVLGFVTLGRKRLVPDQIGRAHV